MTKFSKYFGAAVSIGLMAATFAPALAADNMGTMAPKPTTPTVNLACVQTAVDTRDTAVATAWGTYSTAITNALTARRDALKAAWGITDAKARRVAINKAWSDYRAAKKTARNTWTAARRAAWTQFRTDRKACGVKSATSDEGQGQDSDL